MRIITDFLFFFSTCFYSRPSFRHFKRLILGFVEHSGAKAVTELNRSNDWNRHFSTIYDFLKKSKWSHEQLAQSLLVWFLCRLNKQARPILCIDDTKAFKPHAKKLPGLCWHADHHNLVKTKVKTDEGEELTATGVVGQNGHCWVVLGALHRMMPGKWCCFPLKASIFVREKHAGEAFKSKLQLGLDLLESLYFPQLPLLIGDNFYGAAKFVNAVQADVLSLLKSTAVAFKPAPLVSSQGRGRPRKYGRKVKLAEELDQEEKLQTHTVNVYGKTERVEVACFEGLLRGHKRPVRIILVKGLRKEKFLLFTNDLSLSPIEMIEYYSARFQIEIAFRELKQEVGTFNYRLRTLTGILRYVHLSFVAYALLKYLAIQETVLPQKTPWYTPSGLASPRRVQQVVGQKIRAFRIFQGLAEGGYLRKNIVDHDIIRFQAL